MPKFYSSNHIIKTLERKCFCFISQKGSHAKYYSEAFKNTVIIPTERKQIPFGTFKSILRQSGLKKEDFEK
ncbi:MAG: type II toxin-antitoxin system HicA family toxin [bacterium]